MADAAVRDLAFGLLELGVLLLLRFGFRAILLRGPGYFGCLQGFFKGALRGHRATYMGHIGLHLGLFCCYLLSNCTYQPNIGTLSRIILSITGW